MKIINEFDNDPDIKRTRKLFAVMEKMDSDLLQKANLSPFDTRLRSVRDIRRSLYERSFSRAFKKGIYIDEAAAIDLFTICQKIAFKTIGISFEADHRENTEMTALIQEVLT
jgi:hypothetical protein